MKWMDGVRPGRPPARWLVLGFLVGCGGVSEGDPDGGVEEDAGDLDPDAGQALRDGGDANDGATWSFVLPDGPAPLARGGMAMAYDESRSRLVVFGGNLPGGAAAGDTWEWDGTAWEDVSPADSPPARRFHAMAYDADRQQVVMFGGLGEDIFGDTWLWDGNEWTEVTPASGGPSNRLNHGMVFDSARSEIIAFGGQSIDTETGTSERLDETWAWDGSDWTQKLGLPVRPPARTGFGMTYDAARERVVMFGGFRGGETIEESYLFDTWEWNGSRWTRVVVDGDIPSAPSRAQLAFDPEREQVLLFGGQLIDAATDSSEIFDETWVFDGGSWQQLSPRESPSANAGHALAYNEAEDHIVLYGGRTGVLWTWDPQGAAAESPTSGR